VKFFKNLLMDGDEGKTPAFLKYFSSFKTQGQSQQL
jgi:hypothetical protein